MLTLSTKDKFLYSFSELSQKETVDKITVKEIASNCGLTSQTFYNHFSDKYDMIFWAYRKRVDGLFDKYCNGEITWRELLEKYLADYKKNSKTILNIMKNTHGNDSYYTGSSSYLLKCMREVFIKKLGPDKLDIKADMLLHNYVTGLANSIGRWLDREEDLDETEMAEILDMALPQYLRNLYLNG